MEFVSDAVEKFERAVDTVSKSPPIHRSRQPLQIEIPEGAEIEFSALSGAVSLKDEKQLRWSDTVLKSAKRAPHT